MDKLKEVIKSIFHKDNIAALLKLIIGLVILFPLTYSLFWFYSSLFFSAFFINIDDIMSYYTITKSSDIEIFRHALSEGVGTAFYALNVPIIIMVLGFCIHFFWIQKSWHKYFKIVIILNVIFLYNTCIAYQIGKRMHEMNVIIRLGELDSTYGLAEMVSDVNAWVIIICEFAIFVIWNIVLNMTINTYKCISCKQGEQIKPQQTTEVDTAKIVELIESLPYEKYANIDPTIMLAHNKALEESPKYQKILPEVMTEVYTKYVVYKIDSLERFLKKSIDEGFGWVDETQIQITQAKQLLSENKIEEAFDIVKTFGACHTLWPLKQHILYNKYGITWYTPIECYPDTCFD